MIPGVIYVSGLSDDDNRLVNRLLHRLGEKMPKNLLRETYYDSKRVARQISSVVPPQYHRMGVALGWAAKTVDGLANRCNLDGFVWPAGILSRPVCRCCWMRTVSCLRFVAVSRRRCCMGRRSL